MTSAGNSRFTVDAPTISIHGAIFTVVCGPGPEWQTEQETTSLCLTAPKAPIEYGYIKGRGIAIGTDWNWDDINTVRNCLFYCCQYIWVTATWWPADFVSSYVCLGGYATGLPTCILVEPCIWWNGTSSSWRGVGPVALRIKRRPSSMKNSFLGYMTWCTEYTTLICIRTS